MGNKTIGIRKLTARVHQEDDMFVAECIEIGTVSQGNSIKTALENLKEATELFLEEDPSSNKENVVLKLKQLVNP